MPKCNFNKVAIEIALRHRCSPVNLLHIFRTPFPRKTSGRLLLLLPKAVAQSCFVKKVFLKICSKFTYRKTPAITSFFQ